MSGCIPNLTSLHSPVFLLNSCLDLFSAPLSPEDPFSRSYGVSLPSSLATTLSTPQYILPDYVCPFAVRVPNRLKCSGFSREYDYLRCRTPPRGTPYCSASAQGVYFTAPVSTFARQRTHPSVRGSSTAPSPHHPERKSRNINRVGHRHRRSAEA